MIEPPKRKRASDVEVNLKAPGQRFKSDVKTTTTKFGKVKGMKRNRNKICDVCGKPWISSIRIIYGINGKRCVHEAKSGIVNEADKAVQRMSGRLAPGEVAVKGGDGMVRIYG